MAANQVTVSPSGGRRAARDAAPSRRVGSQLTAEEVADIRHMREEEKLARDVYLALGAKWDVPIFANIAASEQQHMDAMAKLIAKYGLKDPVVDDTPGKFTSREFSELYAGLVQAGSASVMAAYKVGAQIEEMDIVDLRTAMTVTTHTDVQSVYENLMRGSRNHLRAFTAQIASAGDTYEIQYLSQAEFNAIASSPIETGRARGR